MKINSRNCQKRLKMQRLSFSWSLSRGTCHWASPKHSLHPSRLQHSSLLGTARPTNHKSSLLFLLLSSPQHPSSPALLRRRLRRSTSTKASPSPSESRARNYRQGAPPSIRRPRPPLLLASPSPPACTGGIPVLDPGPGPPTIAEDRSTHCSVDPRRGG